MAFLNYKKRPKKSTKKVRQAKVAKKFGCKVCRYRRVKERNAELSCLTLPRGSKSPEVYILGGQFGIEGNLLDKLKRGTSLKDVAIRVGNIELCSTTFKQIVPDKNVVDCCRTNVENDIYLSKPKIVVGLGKAPLDWMIGRNLIMWQRGRKFPCKIKDHTFWFIPIHSMTEILDQHEEQKRDYTDLDAITVRDLNFIHETLSEVPEVVVPTDDNFNLNPTIEELQEFLSSDEPVAIDIETTGLYAFEKNARILSIAFSREDAHMGILVDHISQNKLLAKQVHNTLEEFFNRKDVLKIAHNVKFEMSWLMKYYGESILDTDWMDTMTQAYIIDERACKEVSLLGLDALCQERLGFKLKELSDIDIKNLEAQPIKKLLLYNARDTKYTYLLYKKQLDIIDDIKDNDKLIELIDHHVEVSKTLAVTESRGVLVDQEEQARLYEDIMSKINPLVEQIEAIPEVIAYKAANRNKFKYGSTAALTKIFRDYYKEECLGTTKDSSWKFDDEILRQYAKRGNPLAKLLPKFRKHDKLRSTYIEPVATHMYEGYLHPNFNSMFTATGRFSSDKPNIQNFPSRANKHVRKMITAPKGHWFVACDYGQLEARVIAMVTGEYKIVESDIHMEWAIKTAQLYPYAAGVEKFEDLTDDALKKFRKGIKNSLVFPLFYGCSHYKVSQLLGITINESKYLCDLFWAEFPKVLAWQKKVSILYRTHGYVESLTGRRRRAPIAHNQIINSPIQGGASDIVVMGMGQVGSVS